ncbi:MAG: ABC transporter substrate-binding protein [Janthinobacterium lividum]
MRSSQSKVLAILTLVVLGSPPGLSQAADSIPAKPTQLVMNVYAGVYEACVRQTVLPRFETDSGIKLVLVTNAPPLAKLQAEGDAPEIDVMLGGAVDVLAASNQGLLTPLTTANVRGANDILPALQKVGYVSGKPMAIPIAFNALGLAYDASQWQTPPTSWFDLVSPKTPGRIAVRQPDLENTVGWLAMIARSQNGKWPTELSDYAPALQLVKANLRPRLAVLVQNSGAFAAAFSNEHVSLAVGMDSLTANVAKKTGLPIQFAVPKEGAILTPTLAAITRTPNSYWAARLIETMLDPAVQSQFYQCGQYRPSNAKATTTQNSNSSASASAKDASVVAVPWEKVVPVARPLGQLFLKALND